MRTTIDSAGYERVVAWVRLAMLYAIDLFKGEPGWEGKNSGYFCVADARTGDPIFGPTQVGVSPPEKVSKRVRICQEKAERLAMRQDHVSSWESREPEKERWGGAVRVGDLIFSFTGLPELGDEAVMLVAAVEHYRNREAELRAMEIVARSDNHYYKQLHETLRRIHS